MHSKHYIHPSHTPQEGQVHSRATHSLLPSCRHSPRSCFWLLRVCGPLTTLTHCGTQVAVEPLLWSWRPVGKLAEEAATQAQCAATRGSGNLDENTSCQGVHGAKQLCSGGQARGIRPLQLTQMTVVIMQPLQPQASSAHHIWVWLGPAGTVQEVWQQSRTTLGCSKREPWCPAGLCLGTGGRKVGSRGSGWPVPGPGCFSRGKVCPGCRALLHCHQYNHT